MTTTLPDIDLASYSVIIKKIRLIFVKDTYLIRKRYVSLFKLFKRGKAIHTEAKRKMKVHIRSYFTRVTDGLNHFKTLPYFQLSYGKY